MFHVDLHQHHLQPLENKNRVTGRPEHRQDLDHRALHQRRLLREPGRTSPPTQPTVGVDFIGKNISHNNQHFRLQLWDTAGQERFRSLVPNYLKDATCAVFVVDLSSNTGVSLDEESIEQIHRWIQLFDEHRMPKAVSVLCGNKMDLAP